MHLLHLEVENFRALDSATLADLPANVVIAGPNGCGKSTIFDAIRLWKSAYGGYIENEFQQWFGEFNISLETTDLAQLQSQFRQKNRPIRIYAKVTLADEERAYIRANVEELLRASLWRELAPAGFRGRQPVPMAAIGLTGSMPEFEAKLRPRVDAILAELGRPNFEGEFTITPEMRLTKSPNPVLEFIYSKYLPDSIGVFDYHSAQRSYTREQIGNVDLRLEVAEQQRGQQALYNSANKYQNVKTQMASNYVRDLIAEKSGTPGYRGPSLTTSLQELFRLFFPDKTFLGPQPTPEGRLTFTVKTDTGSEHDLNDLSSGEKEVLYGYLRLRNIAPKHSVLLLDEPELHLNPKLLKGLPQFYSRHLGAALDNQLWLLTHSDVLLTESLDQDAFAVYHMQPAAAPSKPQLTRVARGATLDMAILALVGEKASFAREAPLVIFEGGGDTEFDVSMTLDLFPHLQRRINTISGTSKKRVRELHVLLERALRAKQLDFPVFSIVDRDSDSSTGTAGLRELQWDVYHIENYLLDSQFIHEALKEALRERYRLATVEEVDAALADSAREAADSVIRTRLEAWVNSSLVRCIQTGSDPTPNQMVRTLAESVQGSFQRLQEVAGAGLSIVAIEEELMRLRTIVHESVANGTWRIELPGREILSRFVRAHGDGLEYQVFRNLIIARMRAAGFAPSGMSHVIDQIAPVEPGTSVA